ncbi:MAG TPA: hypothetical protein VFZ18_01630 [Longimicrobiaceae bacterium]
MIEMPSPEERSDEQVPFLDSLLREALPEIKLALGELIDRENSRSLPPKYAKLLPDTVLIVSLRPDAAAALSSLVETVERDLTDSVMRHGSLYDRAYSVQLRRSEDPKAPLYRVSAHAGHAPAQPAVEEPAPAPVQTLRETVVAAAAAPTEHTEASTEAMPVADPDATRIDDVGPAGWNAGEWVLVVEDLQGEELEAFRLTDPFTSVGRRTSDPELQTTIALSEVPHLSRRQLVLLFEERAGQPGFKLYNLGLNALHHPGGDIPGARVGRGALRLESVPAASVAWIAPGTPVRIGDHGPVLRIDEVPPDQEEDEVAQDPDATVHD